MIIGDWDVTIETPIGSMAVPLRDLAIDGARATWRQSVTKPMRLNLDFDVVVEGDRMSGHSRARRLPRTAVTGVRRQGAIS